MGGKIIDADGELLYEFEDGVPMPHFLEAVIMKAKFGKPFDDLMVFGGKGWLSDLLKTLHAKNPIKTEEANLQIVPQYFLDSGYTNNDWMLREFFQDFTQALINVATHHNWGNMDATKRKSFIRRALFPHLISDIRINEMIEDVDIQLERYASAYNPDYKSIE